jgi:cysteine synthase B
MPLFDSIGNTPLVEVVKLNPNPRVRIMAKLEGANPAGSIKDRIAYYMVKQGLESGQLNKNKVVVEATSGNTGIGLAMVCAHYGIKLKLFMPECASEERKSILRAYGAELALTPGCEGVDGAIRKGQEEVESNPEKYWLTNQYANPANLDAHDEGTGREIWEQTKGTVTHFLAGIGTTGTIMGVSRRLRRVKPDIQIIAVEPNPGHTIQGLKNLTESIIPALWDPSKITGYVHPQDEQAFDYVEKLAQVEGIFAGLSSGAAMFAATEVAKDAPHGSTIVTIFPDRGDRYLSTNFFRSFCAKCPP